jgi:hypothetical protein
MSASITTTAGEVIAPASGPEGELEWTLIEGFTYLVHGSTELISARLGELELRRVDERTMQLPVGLWVSGAKSLDITHDRGRSCGRVQVIPRPDKLDERAWLRMVTDLETWLPRRDVG